jgi:hypothetical protein
MNEGARTGRLASRVTTGQVLRIDSGIGIS